MSVCSQIHTKHINTAVWAERRIVEYYTGGTYGNHWAIKVSFMNDTQFGPPFCRDFVVQATPEADARWKSQFAGDSSRAGQRSRQSGRLGGGGRGGEQRTGKLEL